MMDFLKKQLVKAGECVLVPYATVTSVKGRFYDEPASATRTDFQRDRDRIIHCGAFRKLRNKTQVLIENEGDYYRTRLTHSLEVAQIARSVSRALGLNEDLTEAVALAHDLGHSCFGHAGEWALAECMKDLGGFCHNDQTFRILTHLECPYLAFDGLNLTWETLEGVSKHNGPLLPTKEGHPLPDTLRAFNAKWDLDLSGFAGPEAQIAAIADDIAYNTHDMDDGFRAGFFTFDDLKTLPLFGSMIVDIQGAYPTAKKDRIMHEAVRRVVNLMVADLIMVTKNNLEKLAPKTVADIRAASAPVATLSADMKEAEKTIRAFLRERMYRASAVNRVCAKSDQIVRELFAFLVKNPNCLPNSWFELLAGHEKDDVYKARLVADYIAGMTDPFAVKEHRRLFSTETML